MIAKMQIIMLECLFISVFIHVITCESVRNVIASPNYPNKYPSSIIQRWKLVANSGEVNVFESDFLHF